MQTQADFFIEVLRFMGPDGYYARTGKETKIMSALERKKVVKRKPGTRRVYILTADENATKKIDKNGFTLKLKEFFSEAKTPQQPFVSIEELRDKFISIGVEKELFDNFLIELYDDNVVELEKSFTVNDGQKTGLNYKNKKYFSYILTIN